MIIARPRLPRLELRADADPHRWAGFACSVPRLVSAVSLVIAMVIFVAMATDVCAQGDLRGRGLSPFPKDDVYRLHLVGDAFIDGLGPALKSSLQTTPEVQVQTGTVKVSSLRRANWRDAISAVAERNSSAPLDMAVVMFGANEAGSIYEDGYDRRRFGNEEWLRVYAARVDRLMKTLKPQGKGAVYWVGLPIIRRRDRAENFRLINTVLRERAYANGITYIDSYSRFQDENGAFNRYGPDLAGTIKLLRSKDGVFFTRTGYAKLAQLVVRLVRRDLNQIKAERVVTLAGDATEQRAIQARLRAADRNRTKRRKERKAAAKPTAPGSLPGDTQFGGQKADHGSAEITITGGAKPLRVKFELPRPALSAAIMTLVTRNQSENKPARLGDSAVQILPGGVPLLSTVLPANQNELSLRNRRLSPTQSVFFKVWGKGERLEPKPGRADDIRWPLPEPQPVVRVSKVERRKNSVRQASAATGTAMPYRDPSLPPLPLRNPIR